MTGRIGIATGDSPTRRKMTKKKTKAEVNYGKPPRGSAKHCFLCRHFIPEGLCQIVQGIINPEYLCDEFERQR